MNNYNSKTLMHYGVLGMHWGVRRYQPYPGDYKGDGKYIGKDKVSKKSAKAYVRDASISGSAYETAYNKLSRLNELLTDKRKTKQDVPPELQEEYENARKVEKYLRRINDRDVQLAKSNCEAARNKFGDTAVKDLTVKILDNGKEVVTDRVMQGWQLAAAALLFAVGPPGSGVAFTAGTSRKGRGTARYLSAKSKIKGGTRDA